MNPAQSYLIPLLHQISSDCTHHRSLSFRAILCRSLEFVLRHGRCIRITCEVAGNGFVSMSCLRIGYGTLSGLDYVCTVVGGIKS